MNKTIKEWFEELPEPYKTEAINNTSKKRLLSEEELLSISIRCAFNWHLSAQGFDYWDDLYTKILNEGK